MIEVLRLGHRPQRDKRITTHVCLTARAMGATRVRIAEEDRDVQKSVSDVAARFGGTFTIETGTGWRGPIKEFQAKGGKVVHLTMYGQQLRDCLPEVMGHDVMLVVGAEKVPGDLYGMADLNVAVGNQPHSEVAALAITLERLREGAWEDDVFEGGDVEVRPSARGKDIVHKGG